MSEMSTVEKPRHRDEEWGGVFLNKHTASMWGDKTLCKQATVMVAQHCECN